MSETFKDVESENKLLRTCLHPFDNINRTVEYLIKNGCKQDFFTIPFRQWLFTKIQTMYAQTGSRLTKSRIIKYITDELEEISYDNYISLLNKIYNSEVIYDEVPVLFKDLKEKFILRRYTEVIKTGAMKLESIDKNKSKSKTEATKLVHDTMIDLNVILDMGNDETYIEKKLFANVRKDLKELRDRMVHPEKYFGIDTGISPLTLITGGWNKGELILLLGRPSKGKSIVLLNFAINAFKANHNIFYITIEMPYEQQKLRAFSNVTQLSYYKIKNTHRLTAEEFKYMRSQLIKYSKYKNDFFIVDAPRSCTAQFLESRIKHYENFNNKKVGLVLIDPIYLMKPNNPNVDDPVGSISWDLKMLARGLSCPVIAVSQINRKGEERQQSGKEMNTIDAAYSDKLGQNADMMFGIRSDNNDLLQLDIMKYRDGSGPKLYLRKEFNTIRVYYDKEDNDERLINTFIDNQLQSILEAQHQS